MHKAQHGVVAGDPGNGGLALTTVDGRNLSVWYDGSVAVGSDFGLGMNTATTSDPEGVTGVGQCIIAAITDKVVTGATSNQRFYICHSFFYKRSCCGHECVRVQVFLPVQQLPLLTAGQHSLCLSLQLVPRQS
jgi:hypothetical protein